MAVIIYNPIGLAICLTPAILESFAFIYVPDAPSYVWVFAGVWGLVAFVWDVVYRSLNRHEHWLSPRRGGHFFFIPVCLLGLVALAWYAFHAITAGTWLPRGLST